MSKIKALPTHDEKDIPVYHTAVRFLGAIALLAMGGSIYLAVIGRPIPEVIVAIGSGTVGALVGLLAPAPAGK